MRVGINGMGRVGRAYLRRAIQTHDVEVVAVNDVTDVETLAHLLRYDSTFGPFPGIRAVGDTLMVEDRKLPVFAHARPEEIPWADLAFESTREALTTYLRRHFPAAVVGATP